MRYLIKLIEAGICWLPEKDSVREATGTRIIVLFTLLICCCCCWRAICWGTSTLPCNWTWLCPTTCWRCWEGIVTANGSCRLTGPPWFKALCKKNNIICSSLQQWRQVAPIGRQSNWYSQTPEVLCLTQLKCLVSQDEMHAACTSVNSSASFSIERALTSWWTWLAAYDRYAQARGCRHTFTKTWCWS